MHAPRLAEWRLVAGGSTLRASKTPGARAGQQLQGAGAAKQLKQQAVRRLGGLDNAANVGHLEADGGMTQWRSGQRLSKYDRKAHRVAPHALSAVPENKGGERGHVRPPRQQLFHGRQQLHSAPVVGVPGQRADGVTEQEGGSASGERKDSQQQQRREPAGCDKDERQRRYAWPSHVVG
jgi:hypothetical protein